MSLDLKKIEKLVELGRKHKLAELGIEEGRLKVHIKYRVPGMGTYVPQQGTERVLVQGATSATDATAAVSAPISVSVPITSEKRAPTIDSNAHRVISPFVGTFYRAASPDADPYVKEGQSVRKGDVLCIVEAMKLMNEIESEVAGRVISVLAVNGQAVEYGEPLFVIEPL